MAVKEKEDPLLKSRTWKVENSGGPRPMGGIWLRFYHDSKTETVKVSASLTDN